MGVLAAFGLGVLMGVLGGFGGGRRYERAHHASLIASEYVGAARHMAGKAVGGVVLFAVVLLVGALFVWAGR